MSQHLNRADKRNDNFKVVIRVRPPLPRELSVPGRFQNTIKIHDDNATITISENLTALNNNDYSEYGVYNSHTFTFDRVYGPSATQKEVYDTIAYDAVMDTLKGYNATVMAYGQTSSGKTYTMEGLPTPEGRGIILRSVQSIFEYISDKSNDSIQFLVRASYLQIYKEDIFDLLNPTGVSLRIREDVKKGVFVEGLSEKVVRSPQEVYELITKGSKLRETAETGMNETSSRSHAIFIIICEQAEKSSLIKNKSFNNININEATTLNNNPQGEHCVKIGKLNLVDLAGSERQSKTLNKGKRQEEANFINLSLTTLGFVIRKLTKVNKGQNIHIPYRDAKLTRILQDSLGGNCRTTFMGMVTPALEHYNETLSTLQFCNRAKYVKNNAVINEDLDKTALLRKYEEELKRLRLELQEQSKIVNDKHQLLILEEERRKIESDKQDALRRLEERSRDYIRENNEKRRLEERIAELNSGLLMGGFYSSYDGMDGADFRSAVVYEQNRIRKQYQHRIKELEDEINELKNSESSGLDESSGTRSSSAIARSQSRASATKDKYIKLLNKQSEVMCGLSIRINERDSVMRDLGDELDARDEYIRILEMRLKQLTAVLTHMEGEATDAGIKIEPHPNPSHSIEVKLENKDSNIENNLKTPRKAASGRPSLHIDTSLSVNNNRIGSKSSNFQRFEDVDTERNMYDEEKIAEMDGILIAKEAQIMDLQKSLSYLTEPIMDLINRNLDDLISYAIKNKMNSKVLGTHIPRGFGFGDNKVTEKITKEAPKSPIDQKIDSVLGNVRKDRESLVVILENKVKTLVDKIYELNTMYQQLYSDSMADPTNEVIQSKLKDTNLNIKKHTQALCKIINMSSSALAKIDYSFDLSKESTSPSSVQASYVN